VSADLVGNEPLVGTKTATAAALAIGGSVGSGTAGRVLFEDTGPVLADDAALTFDKSTGTLSATILKGTSLTSGRVPFASTGGILVDSANLTWSASAGLGGLVDDATTNASLSILTLSHTSSGTAAAGFGLGLLLKAESAGGTLRSIGAFDSILTTATDAAEVSAFTFKTMVAGTLTEVVRFGGATTTPQVDLPVTLGRAIIDSRSTDIAYFSHQDMTTTSNYALFQNSNGATRLNSASGQTTGLYCNNTLKLSVSTTGIGFFSTTPVAVQTGPTLNLTNNITSGGTDGTFTNWTDLTTYATDAAAIRNAVYQCARSIKFCSDALRAYGLLT
jgi:hypothetical protein